VNKRKIFILVFIVVIIVIGLWFSLIPSEQAKKPESKTGQTDSGDKGNKDLPDREFSGIDFSIYNSDKTIKWKLAAENVKQFENKDILKLYPIRVNVYNVNNEKELLYTFQAEKGRYLNKEGLLDIKGPVSIKKDKIKLTLDDLNWQRKKDKLTGKKINFSSPKYSVNAASFRANSELSYFVFYGDKQKKASFTWEESADETD
jgi:LPS export ABC transporter protein LptC